ncbi:MAG: PEP-CTERM sorting domain-containing protein [Propionivibrio sp.]|uniref:PEP-CTERM sorting domain-containing protein n=1 Tax=Candidatus Propionivibrio dominans TaxID=2954373 RepID=A0A9D7IC31_9RHOO|nr:PEP-CTERM sorting domain-containing protein [Candidatus Propionivibrio dominans]
MSLSILQIPEPESYAMMIAGLGLLGFMARRKKSASSTHSLPNRTGPKRCDSNAHHY